MIKELKLVVKYYDCNHKTNLFIGGMKKCFLCNRNICSNCVFYKIDFSIGTVGRCCVKCYNKVNFLESLNNNETMFQSL